MRFRIEPSLHLIMKSNVFTTFLLCLFVVASARSQSNSLKKGFIFEKTKNIRLGGISVLNKKTRSMAQSDLYGEFAITAQPGDTLEFTGAGYTPQSLVVGDLKDIIVYMDTFIMLPEVVIEANTFKKDLLDAQHGYRKKGVFYTG